MKKSASSPFSTSKARLFKRRCQKALSCGSLNRARKQSWRGAAIKKQTTYFLEDMGMKPLNDGVLVKRLESEEKTAGGLYIPDAAKEKPSKGEVVACGPGKLDDKGGRAPMAVKPGDVVLFAKYAGTEIKVNGVDHIIMREDDILAIID